MIPTRLVANRTSASAACLPMCSQAAALPRAIGCAHGIRCNTACFEQQYGLFRAAKRPVSSSKTACPGLPDRPFCKTLNTKLLAQWGHRLCRFTTEPAASGARWPPAGSAAQSLAAHPSTGITMPWRQSAPVYSITSSSPLSAPRALKASESISFSPGITTTGAI